MPDASLTGDPSSALGLLVITLLVGLVIWAYRATRSAKLEPPSSARRVRQTSNADEVDLARLDAIMAETREFMARRERWRQLATVRGKVNFEWIETINQLKRDGELEKALDLTFECMDASERADRSEGDGSSTWAGWVERACVILRKLGDVDAEERLLERAVEVLPDRESLVKRLARARQLAEKSRQDGSRPNDGASN